MSPCVCEPISELWIIFFNCITVILVICKLKRLFFRLHVMWWVIKTLKLTSLTANYSSCTLATHTCKCWPHKEAGSHKSKTITLSLMSSVKSTTVQQNRTDSNKMGSIFVKIPPARKVCSKKTLPFWQACVDFWDPLYFLILLFYSKIIFYRHVPSLPCCWIKI